MNLLELSRYAKQCGKKLVELTQEELAKLEEERGNPTYGGSGGKERAASNEMCTFMDGKR